MKKAIALSAALSLLVPTLAFAHAVVQPATTLVSKYETFSLGVPNEKTTPTIGVRIVMPIGVDHVMPLVKLGWRVETLKDEAGNVTEIRWVGGSVPVGQKDVFAFSAHTTTTPTTLPWKIYQTYQGGEVVAWDRDPKVLNEGEERVATPYSTTAVVEDKPKAPERDAATFGIAIAALALSIVALVTKRRV